MLISLIVPCYNEQEALPIFYEESTKVLAGMNCEYEFLFVNDGSKDATLSILKGLAEKDEHVTYLSFSRNFGKEAAIYAGLCNAKGDYVVTMDADMQDPPELLPKMLEILETEPYDSVATRRVSRTGEPLVRSAFARIFYKLINRISDAEIVDGARDYRLMTRAMVQSVLSLSEYNRFSKGIFAWVGYRTKWIEYENVKRVDGETKWSFWKLLKYSIDGIVNFSNVPLMMRIGYPVLGTNPMKSEGTALLSGISIFLTTSRSLILTRIVVNQSIAALMYWIYSSCSSRISFDSTLTRVINSLTTIVPVPFRNYAIITT